MTPALDIEDRDALLGYLRRTARIGPRERPDVETLPGGVSCRTVLVERSNGEAWVLKQALPRLRVDVEWLSDPARIHREALGMEWLARLTPPGSVADLVFEDRIEDLVAMQAVPQPHDQWKALLLAGRVADDHVRQFGALLAAIHGGAMRVPELAEIFDNRTFFETLRLEPYYEYSATQAPEAARFLNALVAETKENRLTLVHGDYSPKNVLVHRDRLVLLDHEVIHWGDGAFDIGFGTTHFLAKALHVKSSRRAFLDAAKLFWDTYRAGVSGALATPEYEARAVRHVVGCVLARAVGRSKLEYLSTEERRAQAATAVTMAAEPPSRMADAVDRFSGLLGDAEYEGGL